MEDVLKINIDDGRFNRQRLIPWWNQDRLRQARVLVLGAGALGNEIVKNLALLGIGHLRVVDFDNIENSNLSRSVLFRGEDEGKPKCEVAAAAAKRIFPQIDAEGLNRDLISELGWGWYLDADVILTGLDGREARLAANRACIITQRPFIDGAIEGIDGVARMFHGWDGPCYECTMGEKDWELIRNRRSCNMLTREAMISGHVPTTATISSVVAGLQVQQAVKALHGIDSQPGTGLSVNGLSFEAHTVTYQRSDECYAHETSSEIMRLNWKASEQTVGGALLAANDLLGEKTSLELRHDIVVSRQCGTCDFFDTPMRILSRLMEGAGICPTCNSPLKLETTHSIDLHGPLVSRSLSAIGIPDYDIVRFRRGMSYWNVLLDGDRPHGWHGPESMDETDASGSQ